MQLTLDAKSEKVVQREIALGHASDPAEVVARALEMLEDQNDWLADNREWLNDRLERSFAQAERGEVVDEATVLAHIEDLKRRRRGAA
jgi:predicted transcriptional regulator